MSAGKSSGGCYACKSIQLTGAGCMFSPRPYNFCLNGIYQDQFNLKLFTGIGRPRVVFPWQMSGNPFSCHPCSHWETWASWVFNQPLVTFFLWRSIIHSSQHNLQIKKTWYLKGVVCRSMPTITSSQTPTWDYGISLPLLANKIQDPFWDFALFVIGFGFIFTFFYSVL